MDVQKSRLACSFALTLVLVLFVACGSSSETTDINPDASEEAIENMPDWMTNPPEDPNHLFATATSTSRSMQTAIDKAETSARGDIATSIQTKFSSLTKQFQEEVGTGSDSELLSQFTQAQKEVVSQVLNGSSVRERDVVTDQGIYRAYVLMEMPIGKAASELMSRLQQNQDMYTRFRSSQAFEELEKEVEKYEEFLEEQKNAPSQQ
jgi:ribosome-associated translation inhibitor RaiA